MTDYGSIPSICEEVGLSCKECTANTAREVARVCKGLRGSMMGQMFVQLYPNPACAPMHGHFAQAYRDASPRPAVPETMRHAISAVA